MVHDYKQKSHNKTGQNKVWPKKLVIAEKTMGYKTAVTVMMCLSHHWKTTWRKLGG